MSAEHESEDRYTLAAYLPRAFAIELKAPSFAKPAAGPGIPTFSNATFPIFMHEVAHLVQDRATFRGVMDFLDMWDQIEAASQYVRLSPENVLLPVVDVKTGETRLPEGHKWAVEVAALRQHREPRRAWTTERFWAFEDYTVTPRQLSLNGRQLDYPFVTVQLVDNASGEKYSHTLGAWEIKEAYSVAVGLLHGGEEKQPIDWFEYLVVERILAKYFGDVSPEQTIAICHWALQDLAPANTMFTLIEKLEEQSPVLPSAEDIFDLARLEAMGREFATNCCDLIRMLHQIELSMKTQDPKMGNMFAWFRIHAERLLKLHLDEERRFPLDTFLCQQSSTLSPEERAAALEPFFKEVEIPLIIWPEGEFYSISNTQGSVEAVFLNRATSDLFHRLWSKNTSKWQCPLYNGCTLSLKDDSDCCARPWKKIAVEETCPYGAAANVMGFRADTVLKFTPL